MGYSLEIINPITRKVEYRGYFSYNHCKRADWSIQNDWIGHTVYMVRQKLNRTIKKMLASGIVPKKDFDAWDTSNANFLALLQDLLNNIAGISVHFICIADGEGFEQATVDKGTDDTATDNQIGDPEIDSGDNDLNKYYLPIRMPTGMLFVRDAQDAKNAYNRMRTFGVDADTDGMKKLLLMTEQQNWPPHSVAEQSK